MAMKKSALSISVTMQIARTAGLMAIAHNPYLYTGRRLLPDAEITTLYYKPNSVYESIVHAQLLENMVPKEKMPKIRIVK